MAAPAYFTAEMVRAMPDDGNRYEVVYGQLLVTPAPRAWHQFIVQRLSLALGNYLAREPVGVVLCSPADISWGPDVLVQPDVFVVDPGEARTLDWVVDGDDRTVEVWRPPDDFPAIERSLVTWHPPGPASSSA